MAASKLTLAVTQTVTGNLESLTSIMNTAVTMADLAVTILNLGLGIYSAIKGM